MADTPSLLSLAARAACLRIAYEHYTDGALDQAEAVLIPLQGTAPEDVRVWQLLGSIKMLQGRLGDARPFLERALVMAPDDPYVLLALGEVELSALHLDRALPLFDKLLAIDPERKHPAANRARLLLQKTRDRWQKKL